jgi:hypothetical protein
MGPRGSSMVAAFLVLSSGRAALAEDIGRDPLAPQPTRPRAAPPTSEAAPAPVRNPSAPEAGGRAWAAGPEPLPSDASAPRRKWYGWETLLVDGAWVFGGIVFLYGNHNSGLGNTSGELYVPIVADYFLGPPIVHLAHGHVDKAFGSLGLRLCGPLLMVAGAGSLYGGGGGSGNSGAGLLIVGVLMIPAAIAIDAAVIAREDVTPEEGAWVGSRVGFSPWVDPRHRSAGLSLTLGL